MKRAYQPKTFNPEHSAIIRRAVEICEDYAAQGYDLTLRQLYYQFVARGYIANKQTEYKRLGSIVNDARLAGLIDWDFVVDRTRNLSDLPHWSSPASIVDAVARQFRMEKWKTQPNRVEVWVEKEALAGVVERICHELDVPFFACRGYVSQSELWSAGQRLGGYLRAGQNVTVLHLGDHDPSGLDMTRDNRERLNDFVVTDAHYDLGHVLPSSTMTSEIRRAMNEHYGPGCDRVEVNRIALNMDQIEEFNPPPNPAKLTDSRVGPYLEEFGDESWELDALPPDVLAGLIRENVEELLDDDAWETAVDEEELHRRLLAAASDRWDEVAEFLEDELDG